MRALAVRKRQATNYSGNGNSDDDGSDQDSDESAVHPDRPIFGDQAVDLALKMLKVGSAVAGRHHDTGGLLAALGTLRSSRSLFASIFPWKADEAGPSGDDRPSGDERPSD